MRIIAVEDEPLFANNLEMFIDELGYDLVGMTDNSEEMLRFFVSLKPDLAIVDINIKGTLSGIEVAQKIAASPNPIPVIFITSYHEHEMFEKAKQANAYAYLIKPFEHHQLQRTIELAFTRYSKPTNNEDKQIWRNDVLVRDSFFIKVGEMLQKIQVKDIAIVEVTDKYCTIVTQKDSFPVRMSLKEIADKLPPTDFVQVHRSYIINAEFIENINTKENTIKILNRNIDMSKNYKENLLQRLNMLR